ncbi:MAG TPA: hypothetical protein VLS49_13295, partial [Usitatibacter sp.]|nr:hypothetical protein [Usitatibacter sp.]
MSSFSTGTALQLPAFSSPALARLWTHDCVLCLAPAGASMLCADCARGIEPHVPACGGCALPLASPALPCPACRGERFAFDGAAARFEYRFPVDRLVQRFKYAGDLALGRWLAQELAHRVAGEPRPDLLVVPPLSAARLRERGFNPA